MKVVLVFMVVAVSVMLVKSQGVPTANCPPGEHSVLYCPQMAEPSCDHPSLHNLDRPAACGIAQCFCNTPTIRNTDTGKCVTPANC